MNSIIKSKCKVSELNIWCSQFPRTLNCMIGQMKHILAAEQKKTDFKPEDENNVLIQYTNVSKMLTLSLVYLSMFLSFFFYA